jgi:Flp pilus assembly protein TadD/mono/diheme cytochrome c family protein
MSPGSAALMALLITAACGDAPVTYVNDVAPILEANCVSCHRPGQGAPFHLLTYEDARSRADEIVDATADRHMPPWLPEPGSPPFVGERRLTSEQIATIARWADTGAVEGSPARPPLPVAPGTWTLGKPDLVLQPARAYQLPAEGEDVFRNLVISTALPDDRYIRAVEFQPGEAPVHHAVVHLDNTPASRRRDGEDGAVGFGGMGSAGTQEPDGHFIGWAPGRGPIVSAEGRPWRLARGTDLVLELHLIPQSAPVNVQPTVALYFSDAPSAEAPLMLKMGSKAIDIPAGATDYTITDRYELPVDVTLLSVYPHAHYLGKEMVVEAIAADGTVRTLLDIRRWDFHWQQDYRFTEPVPLPRGTTLTMRFTYDNSAGNPANPSRPPVHVMAGPRSTDEMGNLLIQVVPASGADRRRLEDDATTREAAANVAVAELMVRTTPVNAENLAFLGASYVDVGRVPEGIDALTKAIAIDPKSWKAHNEMGGALLKSGRAPEAVRAFQRATRLRPQDAFTQYNLGRALGATGAASAALSAFTRALALNPDFAEAHNEIGVVLFAQGRLTDALVHLRKAVTLAPSSAIAHSDLGGALAQAGYRDEAMAVLRRALVLDPANAAAQANLSRLQQGR